MEKVEIFRSAEGWRHRTVDGPTSEDAWPTPSGALADAGGDSLESVEIIYPDKPGRDTVPEEEREDPDAIEVGEGDVADLGDTLNGGRA